MEQMLKDHAQSFDSTYVFSSEQQQEVKKLYQKYVSQTDISPSPTEKEKLTHLRTLDRSVTRFGLLAALITVLIGTGVHAAGIAIAQHEIFFMQGAVLAAAGLVMLLFSYPAYTHAVKWKRERVMPEIIRLCTELLKQAISLICSIQVIATFWNQNFEKFHHFHVSQTIR